MDQERLKLLEQFVKEEPEDPFNWYALALEVSKLNPSRAVELFGYVLEKHPEYLPTYYHAGNLFLSIGDLEKAKEILQAGINLASQKGEQKSLSELRTLLDELID